MASLFRPSMRAVRVFGIALAIGVSSSSISLAQDATGKEQVEAARVTPCDAPGLAAPDREQCAARMSAAKDDSERAEIQKQYEAQAQGNRTEGDGVPTASPPPAETAEQRTVEPTGQEQEPESGGNAWLTTVLGGAIILGLMLAYGVTQRRRRDAATKVAQDRGTNAAYGRTERR
ncbi:MAG: hypothetical protein AB7E79_14135 [Rhodospirillaceae bacterium]